MLGCAQFIQGETIPNLSTDSIRKYNRPASLEECLIGCFVSGGAEESCIQCFLGGPVVVEEDAAVVDPDADEAVPTQLVELCLPCLRHWP